jgi:outer membrane protein OmpA-like peptidoglycan-associated protein
MHHILRIGVILPSAILVMAGCATKGFVKETVGQQRVEVDQRIDKVQGQVGKVETQVGKVETQVGDNVQRLGTFETRVNEQGQRVEVMGSRMGTLEGSVGDATNTARSAQDRANSAMTRADEVDTRLTRLWKNRSTRSLVEKVDVRFAFNKADLNDGAQTALLGLVRDMKENPALAVELEGYTDPAGAPEYNLALSQRRVDAVRRFLVQQGVEQARIHAIGLGPIADRSLPADQKRRVTVKLTALVE